MKPNETEHKKKRIGNNCHVAKVKASLDHAIHAWTIKKVEERIGIDKNSGGAPTDKWAPPPVVVLSRKLEIHERHSDEGGHLKAYIFWGECTGNDYAQ